MLKILLFGLGGLVALIALLAGVACFSMRPADLRDKRLDERATVDLDGAATISLAPTFRYEGISNSRRRQTDDPALNLEYHTDEARITFGFEQGQHNNMGGHKQYPVVLEVSLYNEKTPAEKISQVTSTHAGRFYTPTQQERFADIQWMPELRDGQAVTRRAGFPDTWGDDGPMRWLIIHTDPVRRVRVDFYAWQKEYDLETATRLVREAASSVKATPALQPHFEGVKDHDRRVDARRARLYAEITRELGAACGIASFARGAANHAPQCIVVTDDEESELRMAMFLGSIPLSAQSGEERWGQPSFRFAFTDKEYPARAGSIDGLPSLGIAMLYWSSEDDRWRIGSLQGAPTYESWEDQFLPLMTPRAADRERVYLFRFNRYELVYNFDDVDTPEFLEEVARYRSDLAAGKIVAGARATSDGWSAR